MDRAGLIRSVSFPATHHYGRPEWDDARNREVFGEQVEPHEHEWRIEVHVAGVIDPHTGWIADLAEVDRCVQALVGPWRGADLNEVIEVVRSGGLQPSTENLARWLFTRLRPMLPGETEVTQVRVFESPHLGAAFPVGGPA